MTGASPPPHPGDDPLHSKETAADKDLSWTNQEATIDSGSLPGEVWQGLLHPPDMDNHRPLDTDKQHQITANVHHPDTDKCPLLDTDQHLLVEV